MLDSRYWMLVCLSTASCQGVAGKLSLKPKAKPGDVRYNTRCSMFDT